MELDFRRYVSRVSSKIMQESDLEFDEFYNEVISFVPEARNTLMLNPELIDDPLGSIRGLIEMQSFFNTMGQDMAFSNVVNICAMIQIALDNFSEIEIWNAAFNDETTQ